jgi:hypothetical protein
MNFIRSIVNEEDLVLDEEIERLFEELKMLEEPRYTASEWAAMEGGQDIEDVYHIDEAAFERIAARVEVRDMALYRLVVGGENIMKCKNFLEFAKQQKTIPGSFVEGYLPLLEMIDDIVTAGPGYVQMLKVLHKRAKRG